MFATLNCRVRNLRTTLGELAYAPIHELSGDESITLLRELGTARRLLDATIATAAAHVEATCAHRGRGDRSAAETCAKALRTSMFEARDLAAAAKAAAEHEPLHAALHQGRISIRAAVLIGQTLQHAPDAMTELLAAAEADPHELREACLAARARAEDPDERARDQHANRELRTWTAADGMYCGRFRLTPELGGQISALIDAGVQRRFRLHRANQEPEPHHRYAADELAELILDTPIGDLRPRLDTDDAPATEPTPAEDSADDSNRTGPATTEPDQPSEDTGTGADTGVPSRAARARRRGHTRTKVSVHIVIDWAALIRGNTLPGERCEIPGTGPVNAAWVKTLLGDAFLTAVIKDGTDIKTVCHFGRHINSKLRTALLVQGRECDIAGCHARGYLEIDHTHDHALGGPTALHNLRYYCGHHHRQKTAGWILGPRDPTTRKCSLTPPARARAPDSTRTT